MGSAILAMKAATNILLLTCLGQANLQWRGGWGFRSPWSKFRSPYSLPLAEPEPEPSFPRFRKIFKSSFSGPYPEPEPEPSIRARIGGSFSRRFFEAQRPRVQVKPSPSPPQKVMEVEPAEILVSEPLIEQRSLSQIPGSVIDNVILSQPPPLPVWNVDTDLFEIVPAVPGKEPEEEEVVDARFLALPAVPDYEETVRSSELDFEDLDNNVNYEEYLDIINCDFDCVKKFCSDEDAECEDNCYKSCS